MSTINDIYEQYVTGCGQEAPARSLDELRTLFQSSDSRYDDPKSIDAFWILVFGREGDGSDCWAMDPSAYPNDAQWNACRAALSQDEDDDTQF